MAMHFSVHYFTRYVAIPNPKSFLLVLAISQWMCVTISGTQCGHSRVLWPLQYCEIMIIRGTVSEPHTSTECSDEEYQCNSEYVQNILQRDRAYWFWFKLKSYVYVP